jgi:two-component system, NarL family, nitrate/nitrite response regulator NarL
VVMNAGFGTGGSAGGTANGSTGGSANGSTDGSAWDVIVAQRPAEETVNTLIVDHDPISRRVLRGVLGGSERIEVVACVDSHRPVAEWPLRQVDVAVLVVAQGDFPLAAVRELTTRPIQVLLVGMDWTRHNLDAAVSAGASGCLIKDPDLKGLVGGVLAVTSGNMVFSPQLLRLYSSSPTPGARQSYRSLDAVRKLSERELEILALLGDGMSTSDAAKRCGVSDATIKSHVSHVLSKLGARNRLEAVLMINGIVPPQELPRALHSAAG